MRKAAFWLTIALNAVALNWLIASRERLLTSPNSLVLRLKLVTQTDNWSQHGNPLWLQFEIVQQVSPTLSPIPPPGGWSKGVGPRPTLERRGRLVVTLDENHVARFVRVHAGEPLQPGEHLLRYRMRNSWMTVGAENYTFGDDYQGFRSAVQYAEFRLAPDGTTVLVGVCGPDFKLLEPRKP